MTNSLINKLLEGEDIIELLRIKLQIQGGSIKNYRIWLGRFPFVVDLEQARNKTIGYVDESIAILEDNLQKLNELKNY